MDQLSKFCVGKVLLSRLDVPVIKNFFHIRLVHNTGAAFGLFGKHPYLFVIIAVLALILISYFLIRRSHILNVGERIALCFMMGGTLGNLTDRIRFGYVIDFIDFRIWPVFNLADSFISIGAVTLGCSLLAGIRAQKQSPDSDAGSELHI